MARIYGIFTIKTKSFKSVHIMVMQNAAKLRKKNNLIYRFDLKGSISARYVPFSLRNARIFGAIDKPRRLYSFLR